MIDRGVPRAAAVGMIGPDPVWEESQCNCILSSGCDDGVRSHTQMRYERDEGAGPGVIGEHRRQTASASKLLAALVITKQK